MEQQLPKQRHRYRNVASRFQQSRLLPAGCESWINSQAVDPEMSSNASGGRSSGDLPENVTQERLYKGRLFDLAKERHKMMLESDYMRNRFIDHQLRKSKTLDRLLNFDIEQYRNKSSSVVDKLHQKSIHAKLMILATKKLGVTIEEASKFSEEELREKLGSSAEEVEMLFKDREGEPSPQQRPISSRTQSLAKPNTSMDTNRPSTVAFQPFRRPTSTVRSHSSRYSIQKKHRNSEISSDSHNAAPAFSSPSTRPRTASARRRVQNDPRCVDLIKALTPRYKPPTKTDVDLIIRSNPSLSQPATARVEHKPKAAVPRSRVQALQMLDSIVKASYSTGKTLASSSR